MKLNVALMAFLFLVVSGFTWGSSESKKTEEKTNAYGYGTTSSTYGQATQSQSDVTADDPRVSAVRLLASGSEEERKARLESLQRIGAAMAQRNRG